MQIPDGFIFLARKLQDSAIWQQKPATWLKIWLHILLSVNHQTHEAYFVYKLSRPKIPEVSEAQWHRCIAWLREAGSITTRKTKRGLLIMVVKFSDYQTVESYRRPGPASTPPRSGLPPANPAPAPTLAPGITDNQHPAYQLLVRAPSFREVTPKQWRSCIRDISPHCNLLAAATETIGAAELEGPIRKPAVFVRRCLTRYAREHTAETTEATRRAKERDKEYAGLVEDLKVMDAGEQLDRILAEYARRYGLQFVENAKQEAKKG
jgi:hypothetical protein